MAWDLYGNFKTARSVAITDNGDWTGGGITDDADYGGDVLTFGSNATSDAGFICLENDLDKTYAAGTYVSAADSAVSSTNSDSSR